LGKPKFLNEFPCNYRRDIDGRKRQCSVLRIRTTAEANRDGVWVLMSGQVKAGYWHYQCNFVRVSRFKSYDLMIRISDVGPGADRVMVIPTLKGGGTELP
jgi:hypothetical protein